MTASWGRSRDRRPSSRRSARKADPSLAQDDPPKQERRRHERQPDAEPDPKPQEPERARAPERAPEKAERDADRKPHSPMTQEIGQHRSAGVGKAPERSR